MLKRVIFIVEESLDHADGRSIFFQDIAKYLQLVRHICERGHPHCHR